MRALIYGGRDFNKKDLAYRALDQMNELYGFTAVISGMARGADTLGYNWAFERGIPILPFPADWAKYKRAAGPIRNQQMIDEGKPDVGIAFPGGTGTTDMTKRLHKHGVLVRTITPLGN